MIEQHYTTQQVAQMLALSDDTVRRLFRDDSAVLRIGKGRRRGPRGYINGKLTLSIPQSALVAKMKQLRKQ